MHTELGHLVSWHSKVTWKNSGIINEGSIGLHHANASCVSNLVRWIFINPYGCHVKGRASMWRAACFANKTFMRRHRSLSLLQAWCELWFQRKKTCTLNSFPFPSSWGHWAVVTEKLWTSQSMWKDGVGALRGFVSLFLGKGKKDTLLAGMHS